MIDIIISEDALERANSFMEGILSEDDGVYDSYDIAGSVTATFEDLNDQQIYMTYQAIENRLSEMDNKMLSDAVDEAIGIAFEEMIEFKENFIERCKLYEDDDNEDDQYDYSDAELVVNALRDCLND